MIIHIYIFTFYPLAQFKINHQHDSLSIVQVWGSERETTNQTTTRVENNQMVYDRHQTGEGERARQEIKHHPTHHLQADKKHQ